MRRLRRRGPVIVANTANSLIVPFFGVFVSLLVVRLASVELWGAFVDVMIIVQLAAHVVGWGNKEYLLRAFSFNPSDLAQQWQTSLVTRLALFVPFVALFGLLGYPALQWALAVIWCLGQVLYQSNDVLILYRKDFVYSIMVELVSIGLLIAAVAWQGPRLTVDSLIAWFALTTWLKAGAFFFRFRSHTMQRWVGRFYPQFFKLALLFFLLGFSGLLQSRVDLYAVNYYLPNTQVGQYQVFINLLLYLQAVSAFVLMPFAKTIYRLGYNTIARLSMRLLALGVIIVVPGLVGIYLILVFLYHFPVTPALMVLGGLMVLPVYCYLPIVYGFYKANRQIVVLEINVLGIVASLGLNILLLPRVGMVGAIAASAAAQWLMLALYLVWGKTLRDRYALLVPELS